MFFFAIIYYKPQLFIYEFSKKKRQMRPRRKTWSSRRGKHRKKGREKREHRKKTSKSRFSNLFCSLLKVPFKAFQITVWKVVLSDSGHYTEQSAIGFYHLCMSIFVVAMDIWLLSNQFIKNMKSHQKVGFPPPKKK